MGKTLKSNVLVTHEAGKGYKRIVKDQSTVRQTVYKWRKFRTVAALTRSRHPVKISHVSTIRKTLNENGISWRDARNVTTAV